jgi:uncharacterized GH25 family protein
MPLGFALEVLPESDPTTVREGAALPVRVLREGKPAAGLVLTYVSLGETREHVVVTDAEGRASAVLDAPGSWLVRAAILRRATTSDREWDSEFSTMVFDVR